MALIKTFIILQFMIIHTDLESIVHFLVWWRPTGFVAYKFRLSLKCGMWKVIPVLLSPSVFCNEQSFKQCVRTNQRFDAECKKGLFPKERLLSYVNVDLTNNLPYM